jgi:small-conductance mechanosensitive channel
MAGEERLNIRSKTLWGVALFFGCTNPSVGLPRSPYDAFSAGTKWFLAWPLFRLGNTDITPIFLIKCAVFLVLLSAMTKVSKRFLARRILARTKIDRGQQYAIARTFGYLLFLIGLVVGLDSSGLNLRSLVVVGGALGVGIGFGLQSIVANFVAGLVILFEQPIKVEDIVEVGSTTGEIVKIGARGTWVRTYDNEVIIVPNSEFINNRVTNWTANDRTIRISISVGVAYGSNFTRVIQLLEDVARRHPEVLSDPPPMAVLRSFADSSVNFVLRVSSATAIDHSWVFQSDLMIEIARVFEAEKIEMPNLQRDIHVRSVDTPIVIVENTGKNLRQAPNG